MSEFMFVFINFYVYYLFKQLLIAHQLLSVLFKYLREVIVVHWHVLVFNFSLF